MAKTTMPKWQKAPADLVERFTAAVAGLPDAERKTMFGYPAGFVHGNMFAGVFQDRVVVRLPGPIREAAVAAGDGTLFEPMPGRVMKEYLLLARRLSDDPAALHDWLQQGLAYAALLPAKERKGRRRPAVPSAESKPGVPAEPTPNRATARAQRANARPDDTTSRRTVSGARKARRNSSDS